MRVCDHEITEAGRWPLHAFFFPPQLVEEVDSLQPQHLLIDHMAADLLPSDCQLDRVEQADEFGTTIELF